MSSHRATVPFQTTLVSLFVGAIGFALAYAASVPASVLIGPAAMVSLAGLLGLRTGITDWVRDLCFVVLGLGIGAGFDASATDALMRWPLAFLAMAVGLVVTIQLCRLTLQGAFGFDRRSAILAAAPGHLSFVLGLASDGGDDLGRIAVVQTIRLLALTLTVPFVALAMGIHMQTVAIAGGAPMPIWHLAYLAPLGAGLGLVFKRINVPAHMLIGAMTVSALAHVSQVTAGSVPVQIVTPAFLALGTLIGTRFSGMSFAQFRASLLAGCSTTLIAVTVAVLTALPIAFSLGIPLAHVLAAFAPGGFETMIALGVAMGASPGFVAACHFMRLMILTVLIPLSLGRRRHTS
ncbi:AbrB family transcriptional regulator [Arenibacterium sp. CAU 1754]